MERPRPRSPIRDGRRGSDGLPGGASAKHGRGGVWSGWATRRMPKPGCPSPRIRPNMETPRPLAQLGCLDSEIAVLPFSGPNLYRGPATRQDARRDYFQTISAGAGR
jgi:hypothetical protein